MPKILSVGQIVIERQYLTDNIAKANEVAFVKKINTLASSKELNAARVMAKNNDVYYVGSVGKDNDGESSIKYLSKYGINYDQVTSTSLGGTGQVVVITNSDGFSAITVFVGANDAIDVSKILVEDYDFVYTSSANPLEKIYHLIDQCSKTNTPVLVDFPNKQKEFDKVKFKNICYLVPNRQEAGLIIDGKIITIRDALIAASELKELTLGTVIITLDKDDCVAFYKDWKEPKHFPTRKINVVDMTASGDIFRGAFVDQFLKTNDFVASIEKSLHIATESCIVSGVDNSISLSKKLI